MNRLWIYYKQALPAEWCDWIIQHAKSTYRAQMGVISSGSKFEQVDSWRKSTIRWMDAQKEEALVKTLWAYAKAANREAFGVDLSYLTEIQFTEYTGNRENPDKYDFHFDTNWITNTTAHRKLSIVIQLSNPEDYEGGAFEFDSDLQKGFEKDIRERGTVILFPSFLQHRVAPVLAGTRHSLVSWVEGPKWR